MVFINAAYHPLKKDTSFILQAVLVHYTSIISHFNLSYAFLKTSKDFIK